MNREIKFRAYCNIGEENKMLFFTEGKYDNGLWFEHTSNHIDEYLSPLMQFTGLKDKNGVDIYECDLLKGSFNEVFVVKWKNGRWIDSTYIKENYGIECNLFSIGNSNICEFKEVIGNIYENPELLNK